MLLFSNDWSNSKSRLFFSGLFTVQAVHAYYQQRLERLLTFPKFLRLVISFDALQDQKTKLMEDIRVLKEATEVCRRDMDAT